MAKKKNEKIVELEKQLTDLITRVVEDKKWTALAKDGPQKMILTIFTSCIAAKITKLSID